MSNYGTLLSDVPAFLENDSAELANNLPVIIQNAQDRMFRELRIAELFGTYSGFLTQSSATLARPTDMLTLRGMTILTTSGIISLNYRDRGYLEQFWPNANATDIPIYYAVKDQATMMVAPSPNSSAFFYTLQYKKRLPYLTITQSSNVMTENFYDTLLAACIEEAGRFVIDDRVAGIVALYGKRYQEGLAAINAQQGLYEMDGYNTAPKG